MNKNEAEKLIKNHMLYSKMTVPVKDAINFSLGEIKRLTEENERLQKEKTQLMNRCKVMGNPLICVYCSFRSECMKK